MAIRKMCKRGFEKNLRPIVGHRAYVLGRGKGWCCSGFWNLRKKIPDDSKAVTKVLGLKDAWSGTGSFSIHGTW